MYHNLKKESFYLFILHNIYKILIHDDQEYLQVSYWDQQTNFSILDLLIILLGVVKHLKNSVES